MSLSLILSISCSDNTQPPSGELPILKVGDTWTTTTPPFIGEADLISVSTITGEQVFNGIECYTLNRTCTYYPEALLTETLYIDKTSWYQIGREASLSGNGLTLTGTEIMTYNYSVQPYPLSIGKAWSFTVNITATGYLADVDNYSAGQNPTATRRYSYTEKVERVESITGPAGTFQCFKIVQYDDNNTVLSTRWITDVTRGFPVKTILAGLNNTKDTTTELVSYSLSE